MAGLAMKDFRGKHGDARIVAFIEKLSEGAKSPFTTTDGKQQAFNKIVYPDRSGKLVSKTGIDDRDVADIFEMLKHGSLSTNRIQLVYERNGRNMNQSSMADIMKTEEFGGKSNRGDMAEIIFSAAIACRFINKNQAIIESDVLDMLRNLNDSDTHQTIGPIKSQNKNPQIVDDMYWEVNSALINIKAIKNIKNFKNLKSVIGASVKYANSSMVAANAKLIYENDRYNKIAVKAVGTIAQNDTKVDVYVEIDGVRANINVSLKADNTKQFGQIGGSGLDKQQELWSSLFDLKIPPGVIKTYYETLKKGTVVEALSVIYSGMTKEINRALAVNPARVYASLSDGILYYGTKREQNVSMVQLTKKEAMVYNFENLKEALNIKNRKLEAVFRADAKYPEVKIVDAKEKKVLISIRLRADRDYIRNYIEKGALMTELVGLIA